jgi:hypothetical protein
MSRNWRGADFIEPFYDSMVEQFGNWYAYNVVSGCDPSYAADSLSVTVGAGTVNHNGALITVAGSSVTLVPHASLPLWAWVTVNSSGTAAVTHGTAAADPVVPEVGDTVEIALVRVEPNQTAAVACSTKLDKRMYGRRVIPVAGGGSGAAILAADLLAPTAAAITAVPDLSAAVVSGSTYLFQCTIHYTSILGSGNYYAKFTGPTGSKLGLHYHGYNTAGVVLPVYQRSIGLSSDSVTFDTYAGAPGTIHFTGSLITGSSSGTLQYLHGCSFPNDAYTKAKSRLELY